MSAVFECTHSSGCHKQFRTLAEFQAHWNKEHAKKKCSCGATLVNGECPNNGENETRKQP